MINRRDFMTAAAAAALLTGVPGGAARAAFRRGLTQEDLLSFEPLGQVTLLHFTDIHAQLKPLYFREPSVNLGVGGVKGKPPHVTGDAFLDRFGLQPDSQAAYALSSVNFAELARDYGRMGGLDRMATLVEAIRAERPDNTLLLDSGDTWQGSYTALQTRGADMVKAMNALGVDAMTGHWEFTYGQDRLRELVDMLDFPFLAGNVRDTMWEEPVFDGIHYFQRGGVKIALIGQAFPYTPIANPRYMMADWSFGIRPENMQKQVDRARAEGAELVVVSSHNGFDVDRKMAANVDGIDILLTGHTHDALPEGIVVNDTVLIASGSHGKFLSRIDVKVENGRMADWRFRLIPVMSDVITPQPDMAALIDEIRAPYEPVLNEVLGRTETLLYRRGNFNGTFDDVICDALLAGRDAQVALSPGFRWGVSVLPDQDITMEQVYTQTAITYPEAYRNEMTGEFLKTVLEDVADNLFNKDPYYQQGGDMVRVGGVSYRIDPTKTMGNRISDLRLQPADEPVQADKTYVVAGWASVNEGTEGPPVWDVVADYIRQQKVIRNPGTGGVTVTGA